MKHPIVEQALELLACDIRQTDTLACPDAVRDYLRLKLADRPHEVFAVVFVDPQNRVLAIEEMFRGTLSQTSDYPRVVVIEALNRITTAVILCHNHPSDTASSSPADESLTRTLKSALNLVDVRVLDHLIVTRSKAPSFAEKGLL